jgi:hypothetical protein
VAHEAYPAGLLPEPPDIEHHLPPAHTRDAYQLPNRPARNRSALKPPNDFFFSSQ